MYLSYMRSVGHEVCLAACSLPLRLSYAVRIVADRLGWQLSAAGADSSTDWDLCWLDTSVSQERLLKLEPTQVHQMWGVAFRGNKNGV
jgi:hypothetical protein